MGRLSWELLGRLALSGFIPRVVSLQRARRGGGVEGWLGHSPMEGLILLRPGIPSYICQGTCWAEGGGWVACRFGFMASSLGASVSSEVDVKSPVRMTSTVGLPVKGTRELVGVQRML